MNPIKVIVEIKKGKIQITEKGEGVELIVVDHDTDDKKTDFKCTLYTPDDVVNTGKLISVAC